MSVANTPSALRNAGPASASNDPVFGVNALRLSAREWIATICIVAAVLCFTPWIWKRCERFDTEPDYRLPYSLSRDYWLYSRRAGQVAGQNKVLLLGDSVVWGEYVSPDGTLSHFLNEQSSAAGQFVNLGINGLFPLAEEGLIRYYGQPLSCEKVLIQFNFLWLTSPKADLSAEKKQHFNHSNLVPQFTPRIPSYKADANERLGAVAQRNIPFFQCVEHVQDAYFDQKSILGWTLAEDNASPPCRSNSYRNPLSQITLVVPSAPKDDPDRGLKSERHKPWSSEGQNLTRFEWVSLESSLQWRAFQRLVNTLRARGNSVFVLLGPFNEHMAQEDSRAVFCKLRSEASLWLAQNQIPFAVPDALPSELYADSSHPLTQGYQLLASRLLADPKFQGWLKQESRSNDTNKIAL